MFHFEMVWKTQTLAEFDKSFSTENENLIKIKKIVKKHSNLYCIEIHCCLCVNINANKNQRR